MILVFKLSSQVATESNELSRGVTQIVVETVEKVSPDSDFTVASLNRYVRKNAHLASYLMLGILVLNAFRRSGKTSKLYLLISLLVCVLYATSDDVHQAFVPGRGSGVFDVLIDSLGALVGICTYVVLSKFSLRYLERNE